MTTAVQHQPAHPLAWAALFASVIAAAFALYGSFISEPQIAGSPLNVARGGSGLESTREAGPTRTGLQFAAYLLPFALGFAAALAGGRAMRLIERDAPRRGGNRHAVFAIMIGGLSAVVSGCMILAVFAWKHVPSVYTY